MKNIVVPVDFSEQSEYALKVAVSLAKKHKSHVFVLNMLELNEAILASAEGYDTQYTVHLLNLAERKLTKFLDKPYLEGISVTPIVKHYKVFSEIQFVAEKHDADLIVMGSQGVGGFKEMFIGSNTEKVVRSSKIPVLVIKNDHEDFEVKRIVFACNFKDESQKVFKKVKDFANLLSAKIDLLFVNTPGDDFLSTEEAEKRIEKFLAKTGAEKEGVDIYCEYNVERGILKYSEKVNADLIAIPTHGRRGLSHFFMGSIGEDVANHADIPVITFKID